MFGVEVLPSRLQGVIDAVQSKSHLQRLYALSLLAEGETRIAYADNPCDDVRVARAVIESLGAKVTLEREVPSPCLCVHGCGIQPSSTELCFGESAFSLRVFSLLVATTAHPFRLRVTGSLQSRPQHALIAWLEQLGVSCQSKGGYPPLQIKGPMTLRPSTMRGDQSSQLLTGLLMAYAARPSAFPSGVSVKYQVSQPYVEMTLSALATFGAIREYREDYTQFHLNGRLSPPPGTIPVEGDWSGMAFFIVAALIDGSLRLRGLSSHSLQADRRLLTIMERTFGDALPFRWEPDGTLYVESSSFLPPVTHSLTHTPDLFLPLVLWACCAKGTSTLHNTSRLLHKESNRLAAVKQVLTKINIPFVQTGDSLSIKGAGGRIVGGVSLSGYGDHRMIMLGAMLGVVSMRGVRLQESKAVAKSFPTFFECLMGCSVDVAKHT